MVDFPKGIWYNRSIFKRKKGKGMDNDFTDAEIERIDLLHNETNDYLAKVVPGYDPENWDIDLIGRVADAVWNEIKDMGYCTEQEFYPYRER